MLLLWASPLLAQGYISIWNVPDPSDDPENCCSDLIPYEPLDLYIVAYLDTTLQEGVLGAEFKIQNWMEEFYPLGIVTLSSEASAVNGDIDRNLTLIFEDTIPGPWALLATLQLVQFDSSWIGHDHELTIAEGDDCDCLRIMGGSLDGQTLQTYSAEGGAFLINPWAMECSCEWEFLPSLAASWSRVKALY